MICSWSANSELGVSIQVWFYIIIQGSSNGSIAIGWDKHCSLAGCTAAVIPAVSKSEGQMGATRYHRHRRNFIICKRARCFNLSWFESNCISLSKVHPNSPTSHPSAQELSSLSPLPNPIRYSQVQPTPRRHSIQKYNDLPTFPHRILLTIKSTPHQQILMTGYPPFKRSVALARDWMPVKRIILGAVYSRQILSQCCLGSDLKTCTVHASLPCKRSSGCQRLGLSYNNRLNTALR